MGLQLAIIMLCFVLFFEFTIFDGLTIISHDDLQYLWSTALDVINEEELNAIIYGQLHLTCLTEKNYYWQSSVDNKPYFQDIYCVLIGE